MTLLRRFKCIKRILYKRLYKFNDIQSIRKGGSIPRIDRRILTRINNILALKNATDRLTEQSQGPGMK